MARKKYYVDAVIRNEKEEISTQQYAVGLYIRISREDGDKAESDSVTNQRGLLSNYVNDKPDMMISNTYIDDGYTGTNFNRPSFKRMLSDIKSGKINCVIVKDLSRLGRDYIQAGNYLEQLFPFLNCRFISILDNLDSFERPDEMKGIFVRFKHIMNDYYSSEISRKVRRAFDEQRKEGKLVSAFAPYGYIKDPNDIHKLIVDEEAAKIVKQIYDWCLEGMGVIKISQRLNNLEILAPRQYMNHKCSSALKWGPSTVRRILSNKAYIGMLEQKKRTTLDHKNREIIYVPENQRIIVEGTHEPIISKNIFNKVQRNFQRCTRTSPDKDKLYLFSGFLRCADCDRAMIRSTKKTKNKIYVYYKCRTYNQISKEKCSKPHSIKHEILESIVLKAIRVQIQTVVSMKKVISKVKKEYIPKAGMDYTQEINNRNKRIKNKTSLKIGLYEDFKECLLSKEEYINMKCKYDKEIASLEESIFKLKREEAEVYRLEKNKLEWMDRFAENYNIKELSRELLIELIDIIYINVDKSINIKFKYQDEYQRASLLVSDRVRAEC